MSLELASSPVDATTTSSSSVVAVKSQQSKQKNANVIDPQNVVIKNQQQAFLHRRLAMLSDQNDKMFDSRKHIIVSDLSKAQYCDLSPKGSVDVGCQPLMQLLNNHNDYVTTSSCSGRISIFHMASKTATAACNNNNNNDDDDDDEQQQDNNQSKNLDEKENKKSLGTKRGEAEVATGWVFISHDPVPDGDIASILATIANFCQKFGIEMKVDQENWKKLMTTTDKNQQDDHLNEASSASYSHQLTFVVEPFVMHVSCRNTIAAQNLLQAAVQAGYRNSGAVLAGSGDFLPESSPIAARSSDNQNNNNDHKAEKKNKQDNNNQENEETSAKKVEKVTTPIEAGITTSSEAQNQQEQISKNKQKKLDAEKRRSAKPQEASKNLQNSNICEPPSKITVAIRHTAGMSAPLIFSLNNNNDNQGKGGECFVSTEYVAALVTKGNAMMKENDERIKRLENEIKKRLAI